MDFVDWVQVVTQVLIAVTAIVLAFLAYKTYLKTPEQEPESEKEINDEETDEQLTEALVFKTSKQKTWLRIAARGLECHLEDIREGRGGHQWTISKSEAKRILESNSFFINPGYKATSGTFSIGKRRNWLYSKRLFPQPDYLHGTIRQLLINASRQQDHKHRHPKGPLAPRSVFCCLSWLSLTT